MNRIRLDAALISALLLLLVVAPAAAQLRPAPAATYLYDSTGKLIGQVDLTGDEHGLVKLQLDNGALIWLPIGSGPARQVGPNEMEGRAAYWSHSGTTASGLFYKNRDCVGTAYTYYGPPLGDRITLIMSVEGSGPMLYVGDPDVVIHEKQTKFASLYQGRCENHPSGGYLVSEYVEMKFVARLNDIFPPPLSIRHGSGAKSGRAVRHSDEEPGDSKE